MALLLPTDDENELEKKGSVTTIGYDFHNKSNALSVFTSNAREMKPMGIVCAMAANQPTSQQTIINCNKTEKSTNEQNELCYCNINEIFEEIAPKEKEKNKGRISMRYKVARARIRRAHSAIRAPYSNISSYF